MCADSTTVMTAAKPLSGVTMGLVEAGALEMVTVSVPAAVRPALLPVQTGEGFSEDVEVKVTTARDADAEIPRRSRQYRS